MGMCRENLETLKRLKLDRVIAAVQRRKQKCPGEEEVASTGARRSETLPGSWELTHPANIAGAFLCGILLQS